MQPYAYQVVYIDYRGRISVEGRETLISNERRTTFVRRYLDGLGREGWELVGIQPLSPHAAYYVFKRPGSAEEQGEDTAHRARAESPAGATLEAGGDVGETL